MKGQGLRPRDARKLRRSDGLSVEEALLVLARRYPGLLETVGKRALHSGLAGGSQLDAIFGELERRANPVSSDREA